MKSAKQNIQTSKDQPLSREEINAHCHGLQAAANKIQDSYATASQKYLEWLAVQKGEQANQHSAGSFTIMREQNHELLGLATIIYNLTMEFMCPEHITRAIAESLLPIMNAGIIIVPFRPSQLHLDENTSLITEQSSHTTDLDNALPEQDPHIEF